MVGTGRLGLGRDSDGGSGGVMDGWGGGDGRDFYRDGLNRWEDNSENVILWTDPNEPPASAPGLELHHPLMSMLGGNGVLLDIYIFIYLSHTRSEIKISTLIVRVLSIRH